MKYRHKFDHKVTMTGAKYNKLPPGATKDLYEPAEESAPIVAETEEKVPTKTKKKSTAKKK